MAEVLLQFGGVVRGSNGWEYIARACGSEMSDGRWQGWIEFLPVGEGEPLRTGRETTQPDREDTVYWATGLTPVYLEGALQRAERSAPAPPRAHILPPVFDGPADPEREPVTPTRPESVLDPFSVYRNGEAVLRRQLGALSPWHLVNIIESHALSRIEAPTLERMSQQELIELIVNEIRRQVEFPTR